MHRHSLHTFHLSLLQLLEFFLIFFGLLDHSLEPRRPLIPLLSSFFPYPTPLLLYLLLRASLVSAPEICLSDPAIVFEDGRVFQVAEVGALDDHCFFVLACFTDEFVFFGVEDGEVFHFDEYFIDHNWVINEVFADIQRLN